MLDMVSVKRSLRLLVAGFAVAAIAVVAVVAAIGSDDPQSPDLADGALLAVAVVGMSGLALAALWYSQAARSSASPARVQTGFIIRVAIAEMGLLLGVLAIFLTGAVLPAIVGLGLFLIALLLLYLSLNQLPDA
jgi:hypothetical protein